MAGWIKLHRKIISSPVFDNPHLLKMWIWCLSKATHKEHKQVIGLEEITLTEGQFITGRHKGSLELNINQSTWYKHLKSLEKLNMIAIKSNNKMTTVSIVNWRLYQDEEKEKEQQKNNKRTTKEQQSNTNKNDKNDKNDKKRISTPEKSIFAEFVTMTNAEHKKLISTYGEEATAKMIEILDNYKGANGKKYKSDYRAILNWVVKRYAEESKKPGIKDKPKDTWGTKKTDLDRLYEL